MKTCAGPCGLEKPLDQFHAHPNMADGHMSVCKECVREKRKTKTKKNKPTPTERTAHAARIPLITGGFLALPPQTATDYAELEEYWTTLHITWCAVSAARQGVILAKLGLSEDELVAQFQAHSHGFLARGWGHVYPWGELPR